MGEEVRSSMARVFIPEPLRVVLEVASSSSGFLIGPRSSPASAQ